MSGVTWRLTSAFPTTNRHHMTAKHWGHSCGSVAAGMSSTCRRFDSQPILLVRWVALEPSGGVRLRSECQRTQGDFIGNAVSTTVSAGRGGGRFGRARAVVVALWGGDDGYEWLVHGGCLPVRPAHPPPPSGPPNPYAPG